MKKLFLYLVLAIAAEFCFAHDFVIPIRVTDGVNADTLRFGMHAGCSDGYDAGYDRFAPPSPPAGAFDCRLRFPAIGGEDYKTDIRDTHQVARTYYMHYAAATSTGPIVLLWDTLVLNNHATSFTIVDNITGGLYSLNMKTTNSLNTSTSPFLGNTLRIVITPPYPLPVQLVRFTATVLNQRQVRLDWTTISEVNNYGFYVERKRNGESSFTEIPNSFIAGHGTTNERHDYTFTDNAPGATSVWYRLRQVDFDGTPHWTEPIQVAGIVLSVDGKEVAPIEFALKQNYPNPFNPSTEIKFSVEKLERTTIEVYNIIGQKIATLFDDVAEPGQYYRVRFDGAENASGMYLYRLHCQTKSDVKKFMLIK